MSDILRLELTVAERANPLWYDKLLPYFKARLEEARAMNDNPDLGPEPTAALRARIKLLKGLVAADSPPPIEES